MDFQNIGNTARTLMQHLADIVFVPEKHFSHPEKEVTKNKYKNRLHAYIKSELQGDNNYELRKFTGRAIDFTESAIDLMNTTTHRLNAHSLFADACVLSALNIVSLVKSIHNRSNED